MDKKAIERSLIKHSKGSSFISKNGLRKWLGCNCETAEGILQGLDFLPGKGAAGNRYLIGDVAARINAMKTRPVEIRNDSKTRQGN